MPLRDLGRGEVDGRLSKREDAKWDSFSWLTMRALISSANDVLGKGAPRLVTDLRGRWVSRQRAAAGAGDWDADWVVRPEASTGSFLVVGDPGEQDRSQYVVAPAIEAVDSDFMVICSDVIYPAGDVNDYVDGFYVPYEDYPQPIYGLPGNHDWYDGLSGFMWHFCGADGLPAVPYLSTSFSPRERLAAFFWRRPSAPQRDRLTARRSERAKKRGERWRPLQPGPYFAMDYDGVRVVCIDTGIAGEIDREQAEWLLHVSHSSDMPKILLTGKPLVVDMEYRPCPISAHGPGEHPVLTNADGEAFKTVDDIVTYEPHRYVAAIGGDIHNHQDYEVTLGEEKRPFRYIVSGGGGAYMSATHTIGGRSGPGELRDEEGEEPDGIDVLNRTFYPTPPQSLAYFSRGLLPMVWRLVLAAMLVTIGYGVAFGITRFASDAALEVTTLATGAATLGWLLALLLGPRKCSPCLRARPVQVAGLIALGASVALGGWWLVPDRFDENLACAAALVGGGALSAWLLRRTGWWRCRAKEETGPGSFRQIVAMIAWGMVGAGAALAGWLNDQEVLGTVAAAFFLVTLVGWLLRGRHSWSETVAQVVAYVSQLALGLAVIYAWPLDHQIPGREIWHGAVIVALLAVLVLVLLLGTDYLRRRVPRTYKAWIALGLAVVAGIGVTVGLLLVGWVDTTVVAVVVLLGTLLLGALYAHLMFLGAFMLIWRTGDRAGSLSADEAAAGIDWRANPSQAPASGRVKRIVNIAYPGALTPHGPIHRMVSEMFDSDKPPFYKSFLQVEVERKDVVITPWAVTGVAEQPVASPIGEPIRLKLK